MRSGRCCRTAAEGLLLAILLFLLPAAAGAEDFRMPAPAVLTEAETASVLANGSVERSQWLDAAFTLLEEGNPFTARYNLLTGADVRARMRFGIPYLYGGQAANHVFAKEPDYIVQSAWMNSPAYYVAGLKYLYGFDCVGYVKWVWGQVTSEDWPTSDGLLADQPRHVLDLRDLAPDWETVAAMLRPGDILVLRHPGNHVALYVGTLRAFGYTAEEVPALAPYLDYPLVIHSNTNAAVARRFDWLLHNGLPKYRAATVTDGGVAVSILGAPTSAAPGHVNEQNQDTWYFTLPDGTWLTVLPWEQVADYCWWHSDRPLAAATVRSRGDKPATVSNDDGNTPNLTGRCSFASTRTTGSLKALTDGKNDTCVTVMKDGGAVEIRSEEPVWGVYVSLYWLYSRPVAYELQVGDGLGGWRTAGTGGEFLTGWHPLAEPATHLRIVSTGEVSMAIAELKLFGEGEKPGYVQAWQTAEQCDLMLLTACPGDEIRWFGGLLPTLAGERGLTVQCVVLAPGDGRRRLEFLSALWHCGVRVYPELLNFPDTNARQLRGQYDSWRGQTMVLTSVVEAVRKHRPQVLVTHSAAGEEGHGARMLAADAARRAVTLAAQPASFPESAAAYGPWQVRKLYLRGFVEPVVRCRWDLPLEAFGEKTALQVADEACTFYVSRMGRDRTFTLPSETGETVLGLLWTDVGPDTGIGDLMEHIE